ncbi:conserved Plasmodium protein, unknown function [Plasmodium malariae]|uniref:Uncharacterized protein n=1 Tax=Plasmodium malariae TaxID=5858 RepID=A0A1C3KCL7_PLAMA|nr:conserved Plasmodium protein, unknown function [Plasmodium malariae]
MWIEKDTRENCTHGGALSKQVNNDIETLKKRNNFLCNNKSRNIFSESIRTNSGGNLSKYSKNDSPVGVDQKKDMKARYDSSNNTIVTSNIFEEGLSKKCMNRSINFNSTNTCKRTNESDKSYEQDKLKDKFYLNSNKNKTMFNSTNLGKGKKLDFLNNVNDEMVEKSTQNFDNMKSKNSYNMNPNYYKNTQYLNNSSIYNDSIINNNTVLCQDYADMKELHMEVHSHFWKRNKCNIINSR